MLKAKQQSHFSGWPRSIWASVRFFSTWAKSMRNARFGWVLLCSLIVASSCRAPSRDWNGTWKLNPNKSSFQGQILTISIMPGGEYRFDENSRHTLRCDGKDRAIGNRRTLACVERGVTVLDVTQRENGVETRATHDELSPDGKVFTTTVTEYRPNEPVISSQFTFTRLSGSNGFAGQWRDTSYLQQHANMILKLDKKALHINYPTAGQQIDAPLDGVDAPIRGFHVLEGSTHAVRPAGRREFQTVTKRQGNVFSQGTLELSNDGRTITDSWWNSDKLAAKSTLVYEKQ